MKKSKSKQEKIEALKKSIMLRERWLNAIHSGLNAEEMAKIGIKTLPIGK